VKEFDTFEQNVDWKEPVDYIEPEELNSSDYREAALKFTRVISLSLSYILSQRDTNLALYGVIYALGLSHLVEGKSMRELAEELDVTCASLSQHARDARQYIGLDPSFLQQSLERAQKSREIREKNE